MKAIISLTPTQLKALFTVLAFYIPIASKYLTENEIEDLELIKTQVEKELNNDTN